MKILPNMLLTPEGKPQIFYHGVASGQIALSQPPIYLAYDFSLAESYALPEDGGKVLKFHVELHNPYVFKSGLDIKRIVSLVGHGEVFYGTEDSTQTRINNYLKSLGHDGIVVPPAIFSEDVSHEDWEWAAGTFGEPQVVVFDIKLLHPTK